MSEVEDVRREPISRAHDRRGFDSGSPILDSWLREHARRNHDRGLLIVDAKHGVAQWYQDRGFVASIDDPDRLLLPTSSLRR